MVRLKWNRDAAGRLTVHWSDADAPPKKMVWRYRKAPKSEVKATISEPLQTQATEMSQV